MNRARTWWWCSLPASAKHYFYMLCRWVKQKIGKFSLLLFDRLSNHPDYVGKIPSPDQYAIGIGKIPMFTSVVIFQMNSFDTYRKTSNGVYLTETVLISRKQLKKICAKYNLRSSTCTRSDQIKISVKKTSDLFKIYPLKSHCKM